MDREPSHYGRKLHQSYFISADTLTLCTPCPAEAEIIKVKCSETALYLLYWSAELKCLAVMSVNKRSLFVCLCGLTCSVTASDTCGLLFLTTSVCATQRTHEWKAVLIATGWGWAWFPSLSCTQDLGRAGKQSTPRTHSAAASEIHRKGCHNFETGHLRLR